MSVDLRKKTKIEFVRNVTGISVTIDMTRNDFEEKYNKNFYYNSNGDRDKVFLSDEAFDKIVEFLFNERLISEEDRNRVLRESYNKNLENAVKNIDREYKVQYGQKITSIKMAEGLVKRTLVEIKSNYNLNLSESELNDISTKAIQTISRRIDKENGLKIRDIGDVIGKEINKVIDSDRREKLQEAIIEKYKGKKVEIHQTGYSNIGYCYIKDFDEFCKKYKDYIQFRVDGLSIHNHELIKFLARIEDDGISVTYYDTEQELKEKVAKYRNRNNER